MQKDSKIWRYDPLGNLKAKIDVSATGRAWNLAMSPRGELYFVTQDGGIYKLIGNSPQLVGHAKTTQWGNPIAFDRDGYAYLLDDSHGKVMLFDPQFHLATDPFAQVLDSLGWSAEWTSAGPAFLREQGGGMTRRVVVARYDTTHGAIVELNDDAVRAPGADITPRLERVQLAAGRAATVGSSYVDTLWMPGGTTTWEIIAGHLPRGISLNSQTGVLSGSPAEIGVFDFSVRAKSGSVTGYGRFSLSVTAALSVTDVANALLGGTPLPDAVVQFLDQQGNRNGSLDVGDLRAYLRAQNTPSVTAPNPLGAAVHSRAMTQQESDRLRALLIRGTR